jgi:hypothetical protein
MLTMMKELVTSSPSQGPEQLIAARNELAGAVEEVFKEFSSKPVVAETNEAWEADRALDRAWGALDRRLDGSARLDPVRYPNMAKAAEIYEAVFGEGTDFLRKPFKEEWALSDLRLGRIERGDLAKEIDALAGPEYLAEVKRCQKQYGEVLGMTQARQSEPGEKRVSAREAMRRLNEAASEYVFQVLATVNPKKPETIAKAEAALKPIDEAREADRKARKSREKPTPEPKPAT